MSTWIYPLAGYQNWKILDVNLDIIIRKLNGYFAAVLNKNTLFSTKEKQFIKFNKFINGSNQNQSELIILKISCWKCLIVKSVSVPTVIASDYLNTLQVTFPRSIMQQSRIHVPKMPFHFFDKLNMKLEIQFSFLFLY